MNTVILSADGPDTAARAAEIIRAGGLLAIPTETVYGLGANGLDPAAVRKIFEAKGRPQDNPLILHVSGPEQVETFCHDVPEAAWALMERFWPGPLTLILPAKDIVPKETTAGLDTVGVRCPDCAVTRAIIRAAGVPIAAPSANLSGKPSPTTAAHVRHDMDGKIDGIVDGGPCAVGVESTIVDLTGDSPRLLRPGGVPPEVLREILGELTVDRAVLGEISPGETVRAPGMKYTHYTPQADVIIVSGSAKAAARTILSRLGKRDRILCFAEELSLYPPDRALAYGEAARPETLAQGLFAALRALDSPEIETVYARCPDASGVGAAVANRLQKAAGFHVLTPMTILGVTGPTGAGKTTLLRRIEARGGCVLDLDAVYHDLLKTNRDLLAELDARFPGTVRDGALDRKALGAIVFADPAALADLNEITGRYIRAETELRLTEAEQAGRTLAAIDAINLLESDLADRCDHTVAVVAPMEVRIRRIMARDGILEDYARSRAEAQPPNEYFTARCGHTLVNDADSPEAFALQCDALLDALLSGKP